MKEKKTIIIIPTFPQYMDICNIFISLFKKNWTDCPYKIVLSVIGKPQKLITIDCQIFQNDSNTTLTEAIYNVALLNKNDFYICLLADNFISKKIDTKSVQSLINQLSKGNYKYCNLYPRFPYRFKYKKEIDNSMVRLLHSEEPYGISFSAFICTFEFIKENFKNKITDLDFETRFLKSEFINKSAFWKNYVRVNKNYFNFISGIDKGKLDLKAYKLLINEKIELPNRKKISYIFYLRKKLTEIIQIFINNKQRKAIKYLLSKLGFKFSSKY